MRVHGLIHISLLGHKLTKSSVLLLPIGVKIASQRSHVLLMIQPYLLNIKGDGIKALRKVLKHTGIVKSDK